MTDPHGKTGSMLSKMMDLIPGPVSIVETSWPTLPNICNL
jgi:hypothetical protein